MLITGLAQGGQLMTTTDVDNWPADAMGVQGPELMERFQKHAERFETEIIFDHIHTVKLGAEPLTLIGDTGTYTCDALIIATGASAMYLGLPSEQKLHGTRRFGLRHLRRVLLQGAGRRGGRRRQHRGRGGAVPLEHRRQRHRGAPARQVPRRSRSLVDKLNEEVAAGKSDARAGTHVVDEVLGDETGVTGHAREERARPARPTDKQLQGVFIAIGHRPNTEIFAGQLEMKNGYIITQSGLEGWRHRDQRPGRVRRRRRAGSRLSAGGDQRRHRLHGGARRARNTSRRSRR